ncbi:uncharacterized protein LOC109841390 [Asparagus officinalis]|uniref:uncharacterized protein LOC109841390 n=1 Tax=Asparagus officinalis TaxID=4686 RepID=UPI00098E728A|nr:uncharacterized protein LOC109841390 [Asparagus officinalis]
MFNPMASSKLLVLWIAISIVAVGIRADSRAEEVIVEPGASDSHLKLEIEQLKSKISSLESSLTDKAKELNNKDVSIVSLGKLIEEKSASIAALRSEIESLQKKGAVVDEEQVGKAHARAGELEKEVGKLKTDKETLTKKSEALEARASGAEKKIEELKLLLGNLEKTNEDQKRRLHKTERALKVAEEELLRAQLEATSKSKVLNEIHGAWLPPWLATQIRLIQDLGTTHWNEHGKPVMDMLLQKISEKSAQVQKWAKPHLESVKTKWIPVAKEKWMSFTTYVEPHVQTVSTKSVEVYEVCRSSITPHFIKVQELTAPYVQEARSLSKPYVERIATVTKPHVEKARVVLKPYTSRAVYGYGKFLESATTYHHQVQGAVHEKLKKYDLTKPLATKELVWFMASALLALPVFVLYKIFSSMFCKKAKKPLDTHANHGHRRHKRRHADK